MDIKDSKPLPRPSIVDRADALRKEQQLNGTPDDIRSAALEEAAQLCESLVKEHQVHSNFICARAIRALLDTPPAKVQGGATDDEARVLLYRAAINCHHTITDDAITLRRNPKLEGNALSQLADRLYLAAVPPIPIPIEADKVVCPSLGALLMAGRAPTAAQAVLTDEEIAVAYDAGNETAKRGGKASECPHLAGTTRHDRWTLGFADGGGDI